MMHEILKLFLIILALCVLGALIYVGKSRHFTDRLVGVNLIATLILNLIVVLSLVMENSSILDIDIAYALLSFQAVVVLSRILRVQKLTEKKREEEGK